MGAFSGDVHDPLNNIVSTERPLTAAGEPLSSPIDYGRRDLSSTAVYEFGQEVWKFKPFIKERSKRRALLGFTLASSGSTLGSSGDTSSTNIGATSTAFAQVSAHLDDILQDIECKKPKMS